MEFFDFFPVWNKLTTAQQQLLTYHATFRKAEKAPSYIAAVRIAQGFYWLGQVS